MEVEYLKKNKILLSLCNFHDNFFYKSLHVKYNISVTECSIKNSQEVMFLPEIGLNDTY